MAKLPHPRMSDAMQMWERSFPGAMEQAGQVRAALRPELEDCPAADEVVLLLSELSTNAVAHSSSGSSGGKSLSGFSTFPVGTFGVKSRMRAAAAMTACETRHGMRRVCS